MVICPTFPGNEFLSAPAVGLPRRTWSDISTATSASRTSRSRWPGLNLFVGEVVHSVAFRNAWPFRDRNVLVVGAGNSASDIAVQLADNGAAKVWLAVRTPPHLVRRAMGPIPSAVFFELFAR